MKLSNVSSMYGAPMGRRENMGERMMPVRMHLARVRLNQGGYDSGGAYWGTGAPLYCAWGDGPEEVQEVYLRALTHEDAKCKVREQFPRATFYR